MSKTERPSPERSSTPEAQGSVPAGPAPDRELAFERERLRITLASIGDAVISTDAEGRVTYLNEVAENLTGWNRAKATGRTLPDVFHIIDELTGAAAENPALRALKEGRTVRLSNHTLLVSRDGRQRPIEDSAAPMLDDTGSPVGAVLVFRDVTERRRSERDRARLAAIVESSEDAIVSKDLQGTIQTWNAGAERLFGYTTEEAVGRSITLVIPPDRLQEEADILARLAAGERIEHFETIRVAKDGHSIDISLTVSPIRDAEGRIVGASKVARDVTERRRAEEERREAMEELKEADRRKDEFVALLAHELRNPLAPLRNSLQVMKLAAGDEEVVSQSREIMERQLTHMVRLVDDLLDVSRITRSKMELRTARVLLADVVSSAVETVRPSLAAGEKKLAVSLPPEPLALNADLTRLAQVFGNLLNNSIKFTGPEGRIWLTVRQEGSEAVVAVQDDGIGIPDSALPDIFDAFSQVDRSIERATGGLGIGLALVKGLVEMHGGTVEAASPGPGQGSTFTVRLPALGEHPDLPPGERESESPLPDRTRRRVLVVDDNRDSAASMTTLLRLLGNKVRIAHDGLEAVQVAGEFHPQVILMDIGMPRLNGYEATRRIREQPWGREIKIVALTGWGNLEPEAGELPGGENRGHGSREGSKEDLARFRETGFDGHLVKPVELADLESLLLRLQEEGASS